MRTFVKSLWLPLSMVLTTAMCWGADGTRVEPNPPGYEATVDRIFAHETQFVQSMRQYTPLVETYIQQVSPDNDLGERPTGDHYFMGRLIFDQTITQKSFEKKRGVLSRTAGLLTDVFKIDFLPLGFMQFIFFDTQDLNRQTYDLKYLRREFLGQVRCMVFDVVPKKGLHRPHFLGRIWVEDQDFNIVRLNGTYAPQPKFHYFLHFDSWRLNVRPGIWVPAYVYTEERDRRYDMFRSFTMKAQTRLWGYDLKKAGGQQELTSVIVDSPESEISDHSDADTNDISPVKSTRAWQRQAEDNVLERLERAGLLAPDGEVSKILQTVVNNLEITNNLDLHPEVRCRVLLTTPLESFTIGRTIVVSRGLLDVLPDEASLAMVLAHELGHIALGHRLNPEYAFSDQMLFPDEQSFYRIVLKRNEEEETAADQKATEFLANSPYKDKLANAALFLRALNAYSPQLRYLITPHYGNRMAKGNELVRMPALLSTAPQLKMRETSQVAALPLGGRIKVDPWDDHLELQKGKPVPLLSPREKMSFEVTPIFPNLARYKSSEMLATSTQRNESR